MKWFADSLVEPVVNWSHKFPWLKDWMFNTIVIALLGVIVTVITLLEWWLLEVLQ